MNRPPSLRAVPIVLLLVLCPRSTPHARPAHPGEEAEEEDAEAAEAAAKLKIRSAHDALEDERLAKEPAVDIDLDRRAAAAACACWVGGHGARRQGAQAGTPPGLAGAMCVAVRCKLLSRPQPLVPVPPSLAALECLQGDLEGWRSSISLQGAPGNAGRKGGPGEGAGCRGS